MKTELLNGAIDPLALVKDFKNTKNERVSGRIFDVLFHAILTGKLTSGIKLPSEDQLSEAFGVSRPVVREALDQLRQENLVVSKRGSGTYVRSQIPKISDEHGAFNSQKIGEVLNGIELRLMIEPTAAMLAARRHTQADLDAMEAALDQYEAGIARRQVVHHYDYLFHEAVAMATGNTRIVTALRALEYDVANAVNIMRHMLHFSSLERSENVMREHRKIFNDIKSMNDVGAKRSMINHIERARMRMLDLVTESSLPFTGADALNQDFAEEE